MALSLYYQSLLIHKAIIEYQTTEGRAQIHVPGGYIPGYTSGLELFGSEQTHSQPNLTSLNSLFDM
jgi:hypothetical protein